MDQEGVLSQLVNKLKILPGIGQKTAQRLAFFLLKMPAAEAKAIAQAIINIKDKLTFCSVCHNIAEGPLCEICQDPKRDRQKIIVVEEPSTLYAIERSGEYKGLYHVLLGTLSPLDGVGPSDIKAKELIDRLQESPAQEVIIATSPNIEGEATAMYLTKLIKPLGIKISRIAYGIPVGIDLEYADEITLIKSIEGRREL
jgi:recombination protein RecR